jgi:ribosomal-protein-alanine N-acetyltransferase
MITPLTSADFAAAFAIEQRAHEFPWSQSDLLQQLTKNSFGLWQNEQLLAFIKLQIIFPEAEILNIAVDPEYQGKKLGRQLLQHIINNLTTENYQRIYLEVRKSNQAAIHLYESLGFNQIGERKNYYPKKNGREDALIYAKELS